MSTWRDHIRRVTPYVPGEQPQKAEVIKLNTNENPYPPAPGVARALKDFDTDLFRKYPDPAAKLLVHAIAENYGLSDEEVFVGVGSDDVLAMAFLTCFGSEEPVLFPDITYSFYDVWADLFKIKYETKKLDDNFNIKVEDYFEPNGGVIFPNPNAPTSIEISLDSIEEIIKNNQDVVVIVDEAYADFGKVTALDLVNKYNNLLVVRTYSKSRAMAGMRIGYAIGNEALISAMKAVKFSYNSYTMNMPSIVAGMAAIKDDKYFKEIVGKIIKTRENAKEKLADLGFEFADSQANFIFAKHKNVSAKTIFEKLKEKKIYVRYFNKPRIDNYLRITIGTDDEMDRLFKALEEIVK